MSSLSATPDSAPTPNTDTAIPTSRGLETCSGMRSPIKTWLPHPVCRQCARMAHFGGPADTAPDVRHAIDCKRKVPL